MSQFLSTTLLLLLAAACDVVLVLGHGHHHHHHGHDHGHDHHDRSLQVGPSGSGNVPAWVQLGLGSEEEFIASGRRCHTEGRTPWKKHTFSEGFLQWKEAKKNQNNGQNGLPAGQRQLQLQQAEIDTYFHIITCNNTGAISDARRDAQMQVLNDAFAPHGFQFNLLQTTRTENCAYFQDGPDNADKFDKYALRMGGGRKDVLNIYTNDANGNFGYTWFPDIDAAAGSPRDGVVLLHSVVGSAAVPGSMPGYNLGDTATHEVGHWAGLEHTFTGGCDGGDNRHSIDAGTPPEAEWAFGCPVGRDTCPGDGADPIHNFMDYTDDACMNEFTSGQAEIMHYCWETFRDGTYPTQAPTPNPTKSPTKSPTKAPTKVPTKAPTKAPTPPTPQPTPPPTLNPTPPPTAKPTTASPTDTPTKSPTKAPTPPMPQPTPPPTLNPTPPPTAKPTTASPTDTPTKSPTDSPTTSFSCSNVSGGKDTCNSYTSKGCFWGDANCNPTNSGKSTNQCCGPTTTPAPVAPTTQAPVAPTTPAPVTPAPVTPAPVPTTPAPTPTPQSCPSPVGEKARNVRCTEPCECASNNCRGNGRCA